MTITSFQPAPSGLTITLFHGPAGIAVGFLALWSIAYALTSAQGWIAERFQIGLRSGIHRRWDRPGARVDMKDGRQARISDVLRDYDAGAMAVVQPFRVEDGEWDEPVWVRLDDLRPVKRVPAAASEARDA